MGRFVPVPPCMAAASTITDTLIQESLTHAVRNVFRTLVNRDARLSGRIDLGDVSQPAPSFELIGNVGFAGSINGIGYLCMSDDFAVFAVSSILGLSVPEVRAEGPDAIKDAIGEVTNMTVGGFKNALCDHGFPCKLTLPTIVTGQNLTVAAIRGTVRHTFTFACENHQLVVDLQIKQE